jgi:Peptidase M15
LQVIRLPGLSRPRSLDEPISSASPHFTWREATRNGTRIPDSPEVTANIILCAKNMEIVRDRFGPLEITSWYRPKALNKRVGGASKSQHIRGLAVDFRSATGKHSLGEIYAWCNKRFPNEGLAIKPGVFCHMDWRGNRARWVYK